MCLWSVRVCVLSAYIRTCMMNVCTYVLCVTVHTYVHTYRVVCIQCYNCLVFLIDLMYSTCLYWTSSHLTPSYYLNIISTILLHVAWMAVVNALHSQSVWVMLAVKLCAHKCSLHLSLCSRSVLSLNNNCCLSALTHTHTHCTVLIHTVRTVHYSMHTTCGT